MLTVQVDGRRSDKDDEYEDDVCVIHAYSAAQKIFPLTQSHKHLCIRSRKVDNFREALLRGGDDFLA